MSCAGARWVPSLRVRRSRSKRCCHTSSTPARWRPVADVGVGTEEIRVALAAKLLRLARLTFVHLGVLPLLLAILAGLGAGTSMGIANGFGVAVLNVSPFMMTLAMASIGFGLALFMTGGVPVYGMPTQFGATLGFGKLLGVPVPVYVTVVVILGMYVLLNWTRMGRYLYAIGGNIKASALSGISTRSYLFMAYVLCGFLASLAGVMLTARLETGEANIGAAMPLRSIAACVIGGVSLRGGTGRLGSVVLAAVFIDWFENGMNLVRIQSYLQMVVLGVLLIFAVVMDEFRHRYVAKLREV